MDLASVDKLLTSTRSVRQRLDLSRPVEPEVIEQCLEIAVQAPSGSNICRYHFLVVTDPALRSAIAGLYRRAFAQAYTPELLAERRRTDSRNVQSWQFLVEHFQDVPVLVIPCVEGRPEGLPIHRLAGMYGNILPAAWSFMLALRARGLGAAWTTLALGDEAELARLLGTPADVTPAAVLPVGYFTGEDFKPAKRVPARARTYWNRWGAPRTGQG
jgi:nitroreductase